MRRSGRRGLLALAAVAVVFVPLRVAQGGAFAGVNGLIAFTCGADVCTINGDGSGVATLLHAATDPAWSEDGTQIAYVDPGSGVSVADANGAGGHAIGAGATSTQPSWSADGVQIAFTRTNDIHTILSSGGGGEQNLTNSAAVDEDPAWSPDGTMIAFASDMGGSFDIWTLDVSNPASLVHVTTTAGSERSPAWSPDGSTIVYTSSGELFTVSSDGVGAPADLHVAGTAPAFSPDGTKIAYIAASGHLAVVDASGANAHDLHSVVDAQPDWQALPPPPPPSGSGAPTNTSYPAINLPFGSTAPLVGQFLTAGVGAWSGDFPITYAYQWKRCDAADPLNGACADISGATSSFYTPVTADYGKRLRVQVTATNSKGAVSQNSESSAVVTAIAALNRATPQISTNNPVVDQTLSLTAGRWDGQPAPTFTYSWRRCDPFGTLPSCVPIAAATAATYRPTVQDIGFSLRVWITGTNIAGTDVAVTNHTFPVIDKQHFAPTTVTVPTIAGASGVGHELAMTAGTFGGDLPIATTFVWQRCDATGAACRPIPRATKGVYMPTPADVGSTLRVAMTATNAYGTLVAQSSPTEPVAAQPPHRRGRRIVGTGKSEYLAGGPNDDVLIGLGGNDTLVGGAGDDRLDGGAGNDVLTGGSGSDHLDGGPGSDTIYAADGERDVLDCGSGNDRAVVDAVDVVRNCEVVVVQPVGAAGPSGSTAPSPPAGGASIRRS